MDARCWGDRVTREITKSTEVTVPDHEPHFTGKPMSGTLIVLRAILRAAADEDDWEQWVETRHDAIERRGASRLRDAMKTLMMSDHLRKQIGSCWE